MSAELFSKKHGALSVQGNRLVDQNAHPIQLKGISTHSLSSYPEYVNQETIQFFRDNWGINVFRLAMYTAEYNGYCVGDEENCKTLKKVIDEGVQACTKLGMYVIIDWHILSDFNPLEHLEKSKAFFAEMAMRYKDYDNVIYEICNEPNGTASWQDIKDYAQVIIPIIREYDKEAIIIVGTPTWSQRVDDAAADPITGYNNIMYTLHFYADTHRDELRNLFLDAYNANLPIFVSEFGVGDASGGGDINPKESQKWITMLDEYGISYIVWNLSNKDETAALLVPACNKISDFSEEDYRESAKWIKEKLSAL